MLSLTSAGRPIRLSPAASLQLEYNSPLFDEETILGIFSYSLPVPAPPNGPVYGFPERPDADAAPGALLPAELSLDGLPLLTGSQRVRSATAAAYSVSLAGGLSGAGLSERPLASFAYGGLRAVPRWVLVSPGSPGVPAVQAPGLTLHANAVVAQPDAYPYVFAPLRNEFAAADEVAPAPTAYPRRAVNRWLVYPTGGTFAYNSGAVLVPGNTLPDDFNALPAMCPFPRLRYVLQCLCEESGLPVDVAQLLPGELGELVLAGNALLVDRGDADVLRFSLADVVPALTVAELLAALRQDWGIVLYQDPATGLMRTGYLRDQVAAAPLDYTDRLAGGLEVTVDEAQGLSLTDGVDGDDALTAGALDQPAASRLLAPVATAADLPATADFFTDNPQNGQVRLVQDEDTYYRCALSYLDAVSVTLTWQRLAVRLPAVDLNGGGEAQAQRQCYTVERPTAYTGNPLTTVELPAIAQAPYRADQTTVPRSSALRLFFYRGLQPGSDGASPCPQLGHRSPSGTYSTRLNGEAGTYAQWLRAWLPVKLAGTSYKQPLRLSALDLARLDLTRKLYLDGVEYLVRKLSVTVPLRKPATAELVRV
ncbi:MAG: hypothetical protein JWP58_3271 [Hymenobacter sp.]|nr:hypothetical protein [Hymenobacter sp.]